MVKRITLTGIILFISTPFLFSQTVYEFTYDDAGNRIKREVIVLSNSQQENDEQEVTLSDSLITMDDNMQFSAYPNPTQDEIHVKIDEAFLKQDNKQLAVYDMNGVLLKSKRIRSVHESIDMNKLPPGSYLLKITGNDYKKEWRILKKD